MPRSRTVAARRRVGGAAADDDGRSAGLGRTRWSNLWVCGGYWRNGILLAPTAARLLADAMDASLSDKDAALLDACRWDRFFAPVSSSRRGCARATRGSPRARRRTWIGSATTPSRTHRPRPGRERARRTSTRCSARRPRRRPRRPRRRSGEGGYEAVRGVDGAASRKSNLELLFGEKALDLPEEDDIQTPPAEHEDFPRAAPDEDDVILSMREVLGDGAYGPELVEGALPADLSGPDDESGRHPGPRRVAGAEGAAVRYFGRGRPNRHAAVARE